MSFEPRDFLKHILVEANYLVDRSADVTIEAFMADETLRRAFVRSLEIIGEAAKKIPDDFRAPYPEVGWRAMAGCATGSFTTTSGSTSNWSGMLFATGSQTCGDRSLRYSRPNTGLQPTAAGAMMKPLRLKPKR